MIGEGHSHQDTGDRTRQDKLFRTLCSQFGLQRAQIGCARFVGRDDFAVDDGFRDLQTFAFFRERLKARRPVVTAARVRRDTAVPNVDLAPIAVDLDLVQPAITVGNGRPQRRVRWLDEAWKVVPLPRALDLGERFVTLGARRVSRAIVSSVLQRGFFEANRAITSLTG